MKKLILSMLVFLENVIVKKDIMLNILINF